MFPFYTPLKPQGDVFRGYRKGTLAWNELVLWTICIEQWSRGFLKQVTWTKIAAKTLGHSFSDIDGKCSWSFVFYWAKLLILWASSVWTFNTRGVYNLITKEAKIPVNLVPFFNDVLFLFYRFLKSGVTN